MKTANRYKMKTEDQFTQDLASWKTELETDFTAAYDGFYRFVDDYALDPQLSFRALFLGSQLTDFLRDAQGLLLNEKELKELQAEAFSIIEALALQHGAKKTQPNPSIQHTFNTKKSYSAVFKAENITTSVSNFSIKPISFELRLGEITSIVGKNGNGKSTLLGIIAGNRGITSGEATYPELSNNHNWKKLKEQIAYISPVLPEVSIHLSIKKDLQFMAAMKGIRSTANEKAVSYIIARMGLNKYENSPATILSSGYKLRFELARQLVWSPKLLIMDEPLANIDIKAQKLLLNDLRNLTNSLRTPISIVLSSQHLYEIENISDNLIYLENGEAKYNGKVTDIFMTTNSFSFLLEADCSILTLRNALLPLSTDIIELKEELSEKIIQTNNKVSANLLLSTIIAANIPVRHFRDISNSSRIFFENEKKRQYTS